MSHDPIYQPPRRLQPPYDVEDTALTFAHIQDPIQHRITVRNAKLSALLEPLDGMTVTPHEQRVLSWLATWEIATVGTIANLLWRCREAEPPRRPR